jgi:hypothetical protein
MTQPGGFCTLAGSGNYSIGARNPWTDYISAYYDLNGLNAYFETYWEFYPLHFARVPGMRYTGTGGCGNPASVTTTSVVVTGPMGTTITGPTLTFDDTCGYWGIYGTVTYTGTAAPSGLCRQIYINAYSNSSYTAPVQYTFQTANNGAHYYFTTNDTLVNPSPTGLATLYLQAYYDANGDGVFDTGDPYIDLGAVTPTTNGLLENISFDDTYIK